MTSLQLSIASGGHSSYRPIIPAVSTRLRAPNLAAPAYARPHRSCMRPTVLQLHLPHLTTSMCAWPRHTCIHPTLPRPTSLHLPVSELATSARARPRACTHPISPDLRQICVRLGLICLRASGLAASRPVRRPSLWADASLIKGKLYE